MQGAWCRCFGIIILIKLIYALNNCTVKKITLPLFLALIIASCESQPGKVPETQVSTVSQYDKELLEQAKGIFQPLPDIAENNANPVTPEKIKLGKILFFDTRLSLTGNNSCSSCHGLSTFGVDNVSTSKGDAGEFGDRNSPTVLNAAFHIAQFWDGRAKDVEEQAAGPILNPKEMAIPSKDFLVNKLKKIKEYADLFKAAYPSDKNALTFVNIQNSIAAFERTLVTPSPFDNFLKNDVLALTSEQKQGLRTFISVGCIQCHNGMTIGGTSFQKFGVYGDYRSFTHSKNNDEGRKEISKQDSDKDVFKVPSLLNVEKTFPYFHDGSVADLKQAIKIMGKAELNKDLTDEEVNEIKSFLTSLTGTVPDDVKSVSGI